MKKQTLYSDYFSNNSLKNMTEITIPMEVLQTLFKKLEESQSRIRVLEEIIMKKKDYRIYKGAVHKLLKQGDVTILYEYDFYDISIFYQLKKFDLLEDEDLLKYIIDHMNLKIINQVDGFSPIHFICRFSSPEMIRYIIDKKVDLESETNGGWKPIHFISRFSTIEMVRYIVEKGVDLECQTMYGYRPIHFACQFSTPEMIQYIVEKGVDLECETYNQWKPIHFVCKFSTREIVQLFWNKKVDVNSITKEGESAASLFFKNIENK